MDNLLKNNFVEEPSQHPNIKEIASMMVDQYISHREIRAPEFTSLPSMMVIERMALKLIDILLMECGHAEKLVIYSRIETKLEDLHTILTDQISVILNYKRNHHNGKQGGSITNKRPCDYATAVISAFPDIHEKLQHDVRAAMDGDPAVGGVEELILAYPGIIAIAVHRVAHELYEFGVPLLPRMMSEWVHQKTGIDIHPGAKIGKSFFIDHGTGVVVGETAVIGDNVKLYQGVTLGAFSFPKDENGNFLLGEKRHPTIGNDITIYANATILGGGTVITDGTIIGASVFLTESIFTESVVTMEKHGLIIRDRNSKHKKIPDYPRN